MSAAPDGGERRPSLLLRLIVRAIEPAQATDLQALVQRLLAPLSCGPVHPPAACPQPARFEIALRLVPADASTREAVLAHSASGWHRGGDEDDFSAVWDRRSHPAPLLHADVMWAELIHRP